MSINEIYKNIKRKNDGSFIVEKNGYPYHIPNNDEFAVEYQLILNYITENKIDIPEEPKDLTEQEYFDGLDIESKKFYIRNIRDNYMQKTLHKISRYQLQKELGTETTNSEEWYRGALEYLEYLRNIPQQLDFPNNLNIKAPPK